MKNIAQVNGLTFKSNHELFTDNVQWTEINSGGKPEVL